VILAKRLDRGVQMIAHDRAVQPAAHHDGQTPTGKYKVPGWTQAAQGS